MQEMVIYGVSFDMVGKQPIVLLKTVDGNKFLPIWIGHPEAASILMKLQGAGTPRPMTHDLLCDILGELDVKCTQVSVTELRENTFFASITLSVGGRELEIDSRPSDAIALAVRSGAPIYAAEEVISESAIEFEHDVEESEDVVEKFKEFLDQVSPRGFCRGRLLTALSAALKTCRSHRHTELARGEGAARIRSTSSSKPMPAASAASGSRLFRSGRGRRWSRAPTARRCPRRASDRRARRRGSRAACTSRAPAPARASVVSGASSAGQTNVVMPIS